MRALRSGGGLPEGRALDERRAACRPAHLRADRVSAGARGAARELRSRPGRTDVGAGAVTTPAERPFKDHFSDHPAAYAAHRPTYPVALVDFLAEVAPRRQLAWDCGCGSGQLSVLLAARFERVVATDASAEQIAHAAPHPKVRYAHAPAEASGLP